MTPQADARLAGLRDLAVRAAAASTRAEVLALVTRALAGLAPESTFVLGYAIEGARARLVATGGAPPAPLAAVTQALEGSEPSVWPLAETLRAQRPQEIGAPHPALLLPLVPAGDAAPAAILVLGVAAIPLNPTTRAACDVLAAIAAGALAGSRATTLEAEIVERTFAAQALRESEQQLATTLRCIGEAVITLDLDSRIVGMNPVAERLTGWPEAEAAGRPLAEVFRTRDERSRRPAALPVADIVQAAGEPLAPREVILCARDGVERPIVTSGAAIGASGAGCRGVVLAFRDRSDERRLEALRASSLELEAENARIQEANRFKSEFLANMSHELRTPLNGIIGFTQLMHDGKAGPLSSDHQEYLGDILVSARHLLRLINDVLDLAKVESGTMEFQPETIDVGAVAAEVRDVLRGMALRKRIRLDLAVAPDAGTARLDPAKLKQVLYNYVSNAVKFTAEGGRVTLRVGSEGGDVVRFEVEDTGIGVGPEDLGRLFVEFQQLDSGLAKRQPGTGLGLALTKRIVEAQGGRVGVRSTLGQGSVFFAALPRAGPTPLPPPTPAPASADEGGQPPGPPERNGQRPILVVDDDAPTRRFAEVALGEEGYRVVTAASGAAALTVAAGEHPAAVVLDLTMAAMDGFEFLDRYRASEHSRDVPVIVWTSRDLTAADRARLGDAAARVVSKREGGAASLLQALGSLLRPA